MVFHKKKSSTLFTTSAVFAWGSRISVWVSSRLCLTIWNMNHDWSLCASHGAGVVASVGFWCECNVQPADGAILQQVGFHAEKEKVLCCVKCLFKRQQEHPYIEACQVIRISPSTYATCYKIFLKGVNLIITCLGFDREAISLLSLG